MGVAAIGLAMVLSGMPIATALAANETPPPNTGTPEETAKLAAAAGKYDIAGMKLGNSARSTLVARCLAEMVRLGLAMGARLETFMGLSTVGELNLCCNSPSSRNMSLGIALGEGRRLQDVLAERVTVQEGVHSAESVTALARLHAVGMPIALAVDQALNHDADIDVTIARLFAQSYGVERVSAGLA